MKHPLPLLAPLALAAALAGCAGPGPDAKGAPTAIAELQSASNSSVRGTVYLRQDGEYVAMLVKASGLKPNAEHGFHVHEKGDCSAPDATSAGGHFNPTGMPHGNPRQEPHHAGDLPALKADASGNAEARFGVKGLLLGSDDKQFVGKAIVVHAGPDDYTSQPAGNSGPRVACGVIHPSAGNVKLPVQM